LEAQARGLEALIDHQSTSSDNASPNVSTSPDDNETCEEVINVSCGDDFPGYAIHGDPFNMSLGEDLGGKSADILSSGPD
jgi:hypothetical protein